MGRVNVAFGAKICNRMCFFLKIFVFLPEMDLHFLKKMIFLKTLSMFDGYGGVAQLVRVPPCHGGCCGFEPRLSRHFFSGRSIRRIMTTPQICGGVAQLVRVPPCHGGCCGFEPRLSRHFFAFFPDFPFSGASGMEFRREIFRFPGRDAIPAVSCGVAPFFRETEPGAVISCRN